MKIISNLRLKNVYTLNFIHVVELCDLLGVPAVHLCMIVHVGRELLAAV